MVEPERTGKNLAGHYECAFTGAPRELGIQSTIRGHRWTRRQQNRSEQSNVQQRVEAHPNGNQYGYAPDRVHR